MPSYVARPFSTTSQVYPAYLPALHKSGRMEKSVLGATVAAVGIGYGIAKYKKSQAERPHHSAHYSTSSYSPASSTTTTTTNHTTYPNRHQDAMSNNNNSNNESLMDAYGDRSSLAELEAAVKAYEEAR
ncbi:hypothetical protein F4778DRAFT_780657 [Xylariomycetidae sp. FL2044]|nr:hypothetical protein F4778DRAFT_780657 [Xylariomycetidae sp. FL2044]